MNKNKTVVKSLALATALTAAGVATTTTAHADDKPASTSTEAVSQTPAQQLTNLKSQQTQEENQMASANAAEMSQANSQAGVQVSQLNEQLSRNQVSQAAADSAALASGTAEINSAASAATAQENASYSDAVASQTAANSAALADAEKNVYTEAQKANLKAQNDNDYASQKETLDSTHQAKLDSLKSTHDQNVANVNAQIKANETAAEQNHDQQVKDATKQVDTKISQAQDAVTNAQNKVNNDSTAVANAQTSLTQAQSQLTAAKSALDDATSSTTTDDDIPHFKIVWNGNDETFNQDNQAMYDAMDEWADEELNNKKDNRKVELNSNGQITGNDLTELTNFAANVINDLRQQTGAQPVRVNDKTNSIVQEYTHDVTSFEHNYVIMNQTKDKHHLNMLTEAIMRQGDPGETLADWKINELKGQIVMWIEGYLTEDNNATPQFPYGHRHTILGLPYEIAGWTQADQENQFFSLNAARDDGDLVSRFVFLKYNNPSDEAGATTPGVDSSTPDISALQATLTSAQSAYDTAKTALTNAQTAQDNDTTALTKAQTTLKSLQDSRQSDIDALVSPVAESAKVKQLKAQIQSLDDEYTKNVNDENQSYQDSVKKLNDSYDAAEKQIDALPTNVDDLKASLQKKLDTLKADHEKKLQAINDDAAKKIQALKDKLAASHDDDNAPIKAQIASIRKQVAAKEKALSGKLAQLKLDHHNALMALAAKLNVNLDGTPKATDVAKGDGNAYVTDDGKTVVLPGDGNVSTNESNADITTVNFIDHEANNTTETSANKANSLPQTGTKDSAAIVALGAVSAMFGLSLAAKRHEF